GRRGFGFVGHRVLPPVHQGPGPWLDRHKSQESRGGQEPTDHRRPCSRNLLGHRRERVMGIEPTTATLATWRSTTELHPRGGLAKSEGIIKSKGAISRGDGPSTASPDRHLAIWPLGQPGKTKSTVVAQSENT